MIISLGPRESRTKHFNKRLPSPWQKISAPFFSRFIQCEKPQGTVCRGPTGFFAIMWKLKDRFCNTKTLMKTQFFEKKKAITPVEKKCLTTISRTIEYGRYQWTVYGLLGWQTSKDNLYWSKKCFVKYCRSYKIISVTPKMLLKTQFFEKKRQPFQSKKLFDLFFSYYRVWETSRNNLWGFTRYFDNYCGTFKSIFLKT